MSCPICKEKLVATGDIGEDGRQECPWGHYDYQHQYGGHQEAYDCHGTGHVRLVTTWHYTETEVEVEARRALVLAFLKYAEAVRAGESKNETK